MIEGYVHVLTVLSAVGSGLMAGAFFVFSVMVMPGLRRLPTEQAVAAMQSFNIVAVRPLFMLGLFGPALVSVALIVIAVLNWAEPPAAVLLVGSVAYLLGAIILTIAFHVPRNDALASVDPTSTEATGHWQRYASAWTAGNHVRAVLPLAAAVLFTLALTM